MVKLFSFFLRFYNLVEMYIKLIVNYNEYRNIYI